jgi:hypothetical protein
MNLKIKNRNKQPPEVFLGVSLFGLFISGVYVFRYQNKADDVDTMVNNTLQNYKLLRRSTRRRSQPIWFQT